MSDLTYVCLLRSHKQMDKSCFNYLERLNNDPGKVFGYLTEGGELPWRVDSTTIKGLFYFLEYFTSVQILLFCIISYYSRQTDIQNKLLSGTHTARQADRRCIRKFECFGAVINLL